MYIIILLLFNILIIVVLANALSLHHFKKYTLEEPLKLSNTEVPLSQIEINKYHSIDQELLDTNERQKNEQDRIRKDSK